MTDLWLISVPLDKNSLNSVEKLKRNIAKTNLASCCKFSIPDLRVNLFIFLLNEELKSTRGADMMYYDKSSHFTKLLDLMNYVTKFQWDKAKYPTALPLSGLADIINRDVSQVETELKSRAAAYNSVKAGMQSLENKLDGSLETRSLNDIVRKEDLVVSEYLTTLLVVVTRGSYLQWEQSYESLTEFVVPRSSRKLYEDGEGGVFSVTLFKRAVCEFKAKAQQSMFAVREYNFDLEEKKQKTRKELCVHKTEQYVGQTLCIASIVLCMRVCVVVRYMFRIFVCWLKVHVSEVFIAWIHLKALRVFVESVLRYGLPVNYQALLLQTDSKRSKKLREELDSLFMHLDPTATLSKTDVRVLSDWLEQVFFHYTVPAA
uniref:V-type proton ATPase subunit C n=1 Tax=Echeneis naucrates TaxID=173247 RepID=A0A665V0A9_ECHNA